MKHGSLFSGIGGFDLAAEWMGWENIFHCEIAEFPRKILKYHFPKSICYEDIKKTDFTKHRGEIDIISGGFPCQPYSNAGKRKGKDDDRHLWPEMLRVIREIQPRFVVGENVAGLLSWNNGMVFHEIITDLENKGYETQAFLIPACATNAPHRRDRIWFIAHTNGTKQRNNIGENIGQEREIWRRKEGDVFGKLRSDGIITDTHGIGLRRESNWIGKSKFNGKNYKRNDWENFPTQSPICGGDDGIPTELDGITFPKWRNESIKGYGNAVVPQVVYQIFKAIEQSLVSL
jgi:DNA (cytosine-5)-methyltransferase 1